MKRVIIGAMAALTLAAMTHATAPDLNDAIVVTYKLSADEEAQFNAHDGAMSAFWSKFDAANATSLTKDYIFMASDDAKYAWNRDPLKTFAGHDDAQLTLRCAYSDKGAYFYAAVVDNIWTPYSYWGTDVVDLYTDVVPQASVADPLNWFNPTQWALTTMSHQIQVPYGATSVTSFNFRKYDDLSLGMLDITVNIDDAAYDKMTMEQVNTDATHRVQEWFIPWSQWGLTAPPAQATTLAFTGGYNDVDGAGGAVSSLRWVGLCDPYCMPPNAATWGEIEIGPTLDEGVKVINTNLTHSTINKSVVKSEAYTLRGDKVIGSRAAGLVVKTQVLANGQHSNVKSLGR